MRTALVCILLTVGFFSFGAETNVVFTVTAYCHCAKCCGKAGQLAANGRMPVAGVTAAGPRSLPLGTRVRIEGIGERIIQDRTPKRFDDRIDIFMENHQSALEFGKRKLTVAVRD